MGKRMLFVMRSFGEFPESYWTLARFSQLDFVNKNAIVVFAGYKDEASYRLMKEDGVTHVVEPMVTQEFACGPDTFDLYFSKESDLFEGAYRLAMNCKTIGQPKIPEVQKLADGGERTVMVDAPRISIFEKAEDVFEDGQK